MSNKVVVLGSINMDFVIRTPHHPQIGETVMGGSFKTFPGGKGANQSVAAARSGANVKLIGRVGQDDLGETLIRTAKKDGIDTQFITLDETTATGVAFILVDEISGQNNIVLAEGANGKISPAQINAAESIFSEADIFTFNLECPLEAIERGIEIAKKYGVKIVMNPAPYQPKAVKFLPKVDYFIPNQIEISAYLNSPYLENDPQAITQKVSSMQTKGEIQNVIVTLGEKGALIIEQTKSTHLPSYSVQAVDTTAAGDAFVGVFSMALSEGKTTLEAAQWGNAAGALAVTHHGAQPSMPTRADLEAFIKKNS